MRSKLKAAAYTQGGVDWRAGYEGGIPQSVFEVPEQLRRLHSNRVSPLLPSKPPRARLPPHHKRNTTTTHDGSDDDVLLLPES